jgi:hypothetical protein
MRQALTQQKIMPGTCTVVAQRLPDMNIYILFVFIRKERQKTNNGPDVTSSEFSNTHSDYDNDDDDTVECVPF